MATDEIAEPVTEQLATASTSAPAAEEASPTDAGSWHNRIPKWVPLALAGVLIACVSFALGRGSDARQERRAERHGNTTTWKEDELRDAHKRWHTRGDNRGDGSSPSKQEGWGRMPPNGRGGRPQLPDVEDVPDIPELRRAQLGVRLDTSAEAPGATIDSVADGSAADEADLKAGDIITSVDGKAVEDAKELAAEIRAHEPGDKVKLEYLRGDAKATVEVTLDEDETQALPLPLPLDEIPVPELQEPDLDEPASSPPA